MERKEFILKGKKALVTGSTQGIGYATARALAKAGCEVWVHCSKDLSKAERIRAEIGAAHAVTADLRSPEETRSLYQKTGPVDILVLNASVQFKERWEEATAEHFDTQVDVNLRSTFHLMQDYYPAMKAKREGRIITLGSCNQYRQHEELPVYAATKCAVMSLVKNAAKYGAPYGVTFNNVSPGAIMTPRNAEVHGKPELLKEVCATIPVGRFGEAEEVAQAILYLCGPDSGYITGADLVIDGGLRL